MEIRDYVEALKEQIEVDLHGEAEVIVYFKPIPNKELAGIVIKYIGETVAPVVYVEDLYEHNVPIIEASTEVIRRFNRIPRISAGIASSLADFEGFTRDRLEVRLYPNTMKAETFISAEKYGFDDLIIVPYVNLGIEGNRQANCPLKKWLIEAWGYSVEEIVDIALDNMKDKIIMEDMASFMTKQMGTSAEALNGLDNFMYLLTTTDGFYGAIAVIIIQDKLKEMFPMGYTVIPSSIHETLIIPNGILNKNCPLSDIVKLVNSSQLPLEEVLSNKHYQIGA